MEFLLLLKNKHTWRRESSAGSISDNVFVNLISPSAVGVSDSNPVNTRSAFAESLSTTQLAVIDSCDNQGTYKSVTSTIVIIASVTSLYYPPKHISLPEVLLITL